MSGGNDVARLKPLERIKADLPEFCTLVSLARYMSYDASNLDEVKQNITRLIEILLTVPIEDSAPSNNQKTGVEGLLYLSESVSTFYADELDKHTNRMKKSIEAFSETAKEMERLKLEVVKRYSTSIAQFEEIVQLSNSSAGSAAESNQSLKELLLKVLDEQEEEDTRKREEEEETITNEETKEKKEEETPIQPPVPIVPTVLPVNSSSELQAFFNSANVSGVDEATDASTSGTPIATATIKEEEKKEEKEETKTQPPVTRRRTSRRKKTTTTNN